MTVGVYLGLLVVAAVPDVWRLASSRCPAAAAAVSWLQARERFCVALRFRPASSTSAPIGEHGVDHRRRTLAAPTDAGSGR